MSTHVKKRAALKGFFSTRVVVLGAILGGAAPAMFESLRITAFDPRDLYTYRGTSGPYAVIDPTDRAKRHLDREEPISRARPGDTIGWETAVCFRADVSVVAHTELVGLKTGRHIAARDVSLGPGERPCGPQEIFKLIPADAPADVYQIVRSVTMTPQHGSPRSDHLPSIDIEVAP